MVADVVASLLALMACYLVRPASAAAGVRVFDWEVRYRLLGIIGVAVWIAALAASGSYRRSSADRAVRDYRLPAVTALRLMACVSILSFVAKSPVSRVLVLCYFLCLLAFATLGRWVARQLLAAARRRGAALTRLLLAGDLEAIRKFVDQLDREPTHGYLVVGVCVPDSGLLASRELRTSRTRLRILGAPDGIIEAVDAAAADAVAFVGSPGLASATLQQAAWGLQRRAVELFVAPDIMTIGGPRVQLAAAAGMPLLWIGAPRISGVARSIKSICERSIAVVLLLLAGPVMVAIGVATFLDSGRPIIYRQRRVGLSGREFEMLKFRSMVQDAESLLMSLESESPGLFKLRNDPRVTRVGRFLRRHSLDELPQLVNVLRGDMVLIGPRPCLPSESERYDEAARRRFLARPGLTGLWQVSGRSDLSWEESIRLDLYYIENWSVTLDLIILWRTLRAVIVGRGAY